MPIPVRPSIWLVAAISIFLPVQALSQDEVSDDLNAPKVLEVVPTFGTAPVSDAYSPWTPAQKFQLAWKDSSYWGTGAIAASVAGIDQLRDANPSFGQGVGGYAHAVGTASADLVIGYYMTEAVFPTLLHQDPRYYRLKTGSTFTRVRYALFQIFQTHGDSGARQFNFSQMAGDATTVLISNAYYPDHRNAIDGSTKFGIRIGADFATNLMKEFGPDLAALFSRKHRP
jgi:hypothetical protein